jgi:hypothetical protein
MIDEFINLAWGASYWKMFHTFNGLHEDAQGTLNFWLHFGVTRNLWNNLDQASIIALQNVITYGQPFGSYRNIIFGGGNRRE